LLHRAIFFRLLARFGWSQCFHVRCGIHWKWSQRVFPKFRKQLKKL